MLLSQLKKNATKNIQTVIDHLTNVNQSLIL